MKATEFDRKFDAGEDVSDAIDWSQARRRNGQSCKDMNMGRKFEIKRVANITASGGTEPDFYEIFEVILVDGEECLHRDADRAFKTREEAEAWISENSG